MTENPIPPARSCTNGPRPDFERALHKGFWRAFWSWFNQTDTTCCLSTKSARHCRFRASTTGMRRYWLNNIVAAWDATTTSTRPSCRRYSFLQGRWTSIARAQLQDISLPPIEVYKISDAYFVKDGNHRVSVARERGQV